MKKITTILLTLVLVCAAALGAAEGAGTITVTGSAVARREADSARLTLSVATVAKEAEEALSENADTTAKVIAALEAAGVAKSDITTGNYYCGLLRDYDDPDDKGDYPIIGYEVNNILNVAVTDLETLGAVIDTALQNGATGCENIGFSTSDAGAAQDEALKGAVGDAKRRAELIAEACGGQLGRIVTVVETYAPAGVIVENELDSGAALEKGAGTQILAEGLSFQVSVTVTFELKDAAAE